MPDRELLGAIRQVIAESPFVGEGHRKIRARLALRGIHTSGKRVLRLTRGAGLLAPTPQVRKRAARLHDGKITVRALARALREQGHQVSHETVAKLLRSLGFSLQSNRKTKEGSSHPDRDAQFRHINQAVKAALEAGQPTVSVDTKKKELVGDFKNPGREWRPKGTPELVRTHDFKDKEFGKVNPYGVYDLARDEGWVSVGIDADTAAFAVNAILSWWQHLGKPAYPNATTLQITADCGGSNGNRTRLWKTELQRLANHTGLIISVCHFPPGTSKWNKIEHRLFSFISRNWRGRPLIDRNTIVSLIGATSSTAGLKVYAQLDERTYPRGVKVSDADLVAVKLTRNDFHGEWNYVIEPQSH